MCIFKSDIRIFIRRNLVTKLIFHFTKHFHPNEASFLILIFIRNWKNKGVEIPVLFKAKMKLVRVNGSNLELHTIYYTISFSISLSLSLFSLSQFIFLHFFFPHLHLLEDTSFRLPEVNVKNKIMIHLFLPLITSPFAFDPNNLLLNTLTKIMLLAPSKNL